MPKHPETLGEWLVGLFAVLLATLVLVAMVMTLLFFIVFMWRLTFG